jgi:hypothetical protein
LGLSLISAGVFLFGLRRKIWFNHVSTYPIPPANQPSKTLSIALNIDASGSFSGFCVYWGIPESVTLTSSFQEGAMEDEKPVLEQMTDMVAEAAHVTKEAAKKAVKKVKKVAKKVMPKKSAKKKAVKKTTKKKKKSKR